MRNKPDFILIREGNLIDRAIQSINNDTQQTELLLDIRDGLQDEVTLIDHELEYRYQNYLALMQESGLEIEDCPVISQLPLV